MLFDFPQHKNPLPQLHILNYLNTHSAAYKAAPGQAGAVGTFYGIGAQSSIALRSTTRCGRATASARTVAQGCAGKPHTRNVFNRP